MMPTENEDFPTDESCIAFSEYLRLRETDPETGFDDFCRLRPKLSDELRRLQEEWDRATSLFDRFGGAPSLADRLRSTFGEKFDLDISLDEDDEGSSSSSRVMERLSNSGSLSKSYRSKSLVARGGMGAILSVWDEDLRRTLAMKIVLGREEEPNAEGTPQVGENQLVRFLEEAQITGQLDHPGILPVHDLGIDANGRVYFTMPLVRGQTLKEIFELARLGEQGWNTTRAIGVLIKVCEAMAFAHSKAVIHRDIKPANIMVGRFGETYVMDWGLAKVLGRKETRSTRAAADVGSSMSLVKTDRRDEAASDPNSPLITMDGDVVGTPTYMSPEQARGHQAELGPPADVYAVGSMLYQLLTGRAPFHEPGTRISLHTVLARLLDGPPQRIEEIDKTVVPELTAICEKAMAREPEDRYPGMLELAEDLRAFTEGHVVRAYESGAVAEFRKWVRRNRMAAFFITTSVVVVFGALLTFILQQNRSNDILEVKNTALENLNTEIRAERDRAEEQEREADRQRGRAEKMVEVARRQSYLGSIRAADSNLKLYLTNSTRELLSNCEEDLRSWEWNYLSNKSSAQTIKFELPDGLASARVVDDGQHVLCCTTDRRLLLWNPDLDEIVAGFSDQSTFNASPAFAVSSPDRSRIFSLNFGGRLWIWDATSGILLDNTYAHRPYAVFGLEINRNGTRLATAGLDLVVFLWDTKTMEVVASYPAAKLATSLAFSPVSDALAVGYADGRIVVWPTSGENALPPGQKGERAPIIEMTGHEGKIEALCWSPDGTHIGSASEDTSARVWNVSTGESSIVLGGHEQPVTAIAFHPDNRRVATGSTDDTIRLWDSTSGNQLRVLLGHQGDVHSLGFREQGQQLVSGAADGTVRIWNLERDPLYRKFTGHESSIEALDFDPDGGILVTASADRTLRLWNTRNGRMLDKLTGHTAAVTSVDFAPDGRRIVSGSVDRSVRIWDAKSSRSLRVLRGHTEPVNAVAYSPDGERIASAGRDRQIRLWDASSGASRAQLTGHQKTVNALCFGAESNILISGSSDHTVRVWEIESGQYDILEGHEDDVLCVANSPDGALIASGSKDGTARVWDFATKALVCVLRGHSDDIVSVNFRAKGTHLVTASLDGTMRIWDVALGAQLLSIESETPFHAMALNGNRTAAAGTDYSTGEENGEVWLWDPK